MPTSQSIINAYTQSLNPHSPLPSADCHVLASKYTKGGDSVTGTLSLKQMLLERWPCDLHFTMYTSPTGTRLLKGAPSNPTFNFCAYDLDYDGHNSKPTLDAFAGLVRLLYVIDLTPNIVYTTRGGARIIYLIDPIDDPDRFEAHYQKLQSILAKFQTKYQVDTAAKDWTRLFRAPLVVRDDVEEYHHQVLSFHDEILDLTEFKAIPKPPRLPVQGNQLFHLHDPVLCRLILELIPGQRNNTLFKALAYALGKYNPESAEKWIDLFREKAEEAGVSEREFETTLKSAIRTNERGQ